MKLTANQLYFISQAVANVQIKGTDALFVAGVIDKIQKELEKQAKAEGLEMPVPPAQAPGAGPVSPPPAKPAPVKETA